LEVWKSPLPPDVVERSLAIYDEFYAQARALFENLIARHERIVVFDLHSYNHCRVGIGCPPEDPQLNPEINLGTGSMDRAYWAAVVDRWLEEMRGYGFLGRRLDVRENVKFVGGNLAGWTHRNFPGRACVLAIEVKKFFMDEWKGKLHEREHAAVHAALAKAASGVHEELERFRP
jgi:hypothetical protein